MSDQLRQSFTGHILWVSVASQTLSLIIQGQCVAQWPVSTGLNGNGQLEGSGQTPLGWHRIAQRIGAGLPVNSVLVARQPTDEIYAPDLGQQHPQRDWILSRILWLDGMEPGFNHGKNALGQCCDTFARYIYIHGTPDSEPMSQPRSHGCIRMRNQDLLVLFEQVEVGTLVLITAC